MKKKMYKYISGLAGGLAIFLLISFLSGCDQSPQSALVWTDVPELVIAAQIFNKENDRFAVDVEYKANVASEMKKTNKPPSLVVGKYLLSKSLTKKFVSLDVLFSKYYLDPNDMYPALLRAGKQGAAHILMPLSFDCMVLVERKSENESAGVAVLNPDVLQSSSEAFTRIGNGEISAMGFSPRWNLEFAEDWLLAGGTGFSLNQNWKSTSAPKPNEANSWPILWDKGNLEESVGSLLSFNSNVTTEQEDAFAFTYFNKPGYQLVLDNRVLYWPMKASEFFRLPYSAKTQLRYRFPAVNQKLLLTADTRYMGIPKGAKNKKAALAFARWLFVAGNQEKVWKEMESQQLLPDYVGPFGGFSSIMQMNETVFSKYFPEYAQNPLVPSALPSVTALPDYWGSFSRDFLRHWLESVLSDSASSGSIDERFCASLEQYLGTMPDWRIEDR
jgi:hypothetical protein